MNSNIQDDFKDIVIYKDDERWDTNSYLIWSLSEFKQRYKLISSNETNKEKLGENFFII